MACSIPFILLKKYRWFVPLGFFNYALNRKYFVLCCAFWRYGHKISNNLRWGIVYSVQMLSISVRLNKKTELWLPLVNRGEGSSQNPCRHIWCMHHKNTLIIWQRFRHTVNKWMYFIDFELFPWRKFRSSVASLKEMKYNFDYWAWNVWSAYAKLHWKEYFLSYWINASFENC